MRSSANHALPVPLVDIERMQVAQLLVGANGVHVGVNAVAGLHIVFGEGEAASTWPTSGPLRPGRRPILDGETSQRALCLPEVVVDAQTAQHKQRCRDTTEGEARWKGYRQRIL